MDKKQPNHFVQNEVDLCPWGWPCEDKEVQENPPVESKVQRAPLKQYETEQHEKWKKTWKEKFNDIIKQQKERIKRKTSLRTTNTEARQDYCREKLSVINLIENEYSHNESVIWKSTDMIRRRSIPIRHRIQQTEENKKLVSSMTMGNNMDFSKEKQIIKTFYRTKPKMAKKEGKVGELKDRNIASSMKCISIYSSEETNGGSPNKTLVQIKLINNRSEKLVKKLNEVRSKLVKDKNKREGNEILERIFSGI